MELEWHILYLMIFSILIVYIIEMWVAYLWAIKSFDLKWWLYEILWFLLLSMYCSAIYLIYIEVPRNNKWKILTLFYINLIINVSWVLYFAFGGKRLGRFMIAMLNVVMLSYNYVLIFEEMDKKIIIARSLLFPFILFIFVGGVSFGLYDIGAANTKYINNILRKT